MPATDSNQQRHFATSVVEQLREAGHQALWAGGCVRDMVLGLAPKDYDVATSATPEQVRDIFGHRRTLPIGASFGVITVLGPPSAGQIEVATFRSDLAYEDGRRPTGVVYASAEADAQRRDFTINGLFFDPLAGEVIDYVDGRQDLDARLIRAIGDPAARFAEDKLRMLRGVRFAARLRFAMHPETRAAIECHSAEISCVSGERIGAELRHMLVHANRAIALQLLVATGLAPHIFPELLTLDDELRHTRIDAAGKLGDPQFATVLATLLAGHGAADVATLAERWKLANRESDQLAWLLAHHTLVPQATVLPWPQVQPVLAAPHAAELLKMAGQLAAHDDPGVAVCRERLAWPPDELDPPPLVTGRDLLAAGIAAGPHMGALLQQIRDAQLLGQISTKDQAIALAQSPGE